MSESKLPIAGEDRGPLAPAEATRLVGLLPYSTGAVVSRTLRKSPAGTLTLFTFDAGQELSEHTTPYDAFVQVVDGAATLTIGGQPVEVHAGEIALMPANVPHAVRAAGRMTMPLTMFRG